MMNMIDITVHPFSTIDIVHWLLRRWEEHPEATLCVITDRHDGAKMVSRIRVALTKLRHKAHKEVGGWGFKQFGFSTSLSDWTYANNNRGDAVFFTRFVEQRHVITEALAKEGII